MREIFAATMYISSITDITYGKIFNFIIFPALLAGAVYRTAAEGAAGLASFILSAAAVCAVLLPFRKGLGGGDIKLAAAAAALIPDPQARARYFVLLAAVLLVSAAAVYMHTGNRRAKIRIGVPAGLAAAVWLSMG